jgi:hypothetical protein
MSGYTELPMAPRPPLPPGHWLPITSLIWGDAVVSVPAKREGYVGELFGGRKKPKSPSGNPSYKHTPQDIEKIPSIYEPVKTSFTKPPRSFNLGKNIGLLLTYVSNDAPYRRINSLSSARAMP